MIKVWTDAAEAGLLDRLHDEHLVRVGSSAPGSLDDAGGNLHHQLHRDELADLALNSVNPGSEVGGQFGRGSARVQGPRRCSQQSGSIRSFGRFESLAVCDPACRTEGLPGGNNPQLNKFTDAIKARFLDEITENTFHLSYSSTESVTDSAGAGRVRCPKSRAATFN
jgi:hypothetical protein